MKAIEVPGARQCIQFPVLIQWLDDEKLELPEFVFKVRSSDHGSLNDVLSKCSSDIHMLIVACDSVDEPTKAILSKGLLGSDNIFYVPSFAVKDDFNLNGHFSDDGKKTVVVYGFSGAIEVVPVPRFHEANGSFEDELGRTQSSTPYTCAVVYRSRFEERMTEAEGKRRGTGEMVERVYLSDATDRFLAKNALLVELPNLEKNRGDIPYLRQYYIMPGFLWGDLAGVVEEAKRSASTARRKSDQSEVTHVQV